MHAISGLALGSMVLAARTRLLTLYRHFVHDKCGEIYQDLVIVLRINASLFILDKAGR